MKKQFRDQKLILLSAHCCPSPYLYQCWAL